VLLGVVQLLLGPLSRCYVETVTVKSRPADDVDRRHGFVVDPHDCPVLGDDSVLAQERFAPVCSVTVLGDDPVPIVGMEQRGEQL
jgi:hypothetical protein